MRSSSPDPIDLLELGYSPCDSVDAWRQRLAAPICHMLGTEAAPSLSYLEGTAGPERIQVLPGSFDIPDTIAAGMLREAIAQNSEEERRAFDASSRCPGITSTQHVANKAPNIEYVHDQGYVDAVAAIIHTDSGQPLIFTSLCRHRYAIDRTTQALWRRLSTHLSAGCRLAMRSASPESDDVDCVLSSDGKVLHAAASFQERARLDHLRSTALKIDQARTRAKRQDPISALELWGGLFSGRWSLVDHFSSDGRRFILARRNPPYVGHSAPGLPLRQRQVLFYAGAGWSNKEIAYALGISPATVAQHLGAALRALGICSRQQWIALSSQVYERECNKMT